MLNPKKRTEAPEMACTWFGEFCSCCSLTALPGPTWVLLNKICKELISSLYVSSQGADCTYVALIVIFATFYDLPRLTV